jgi:transposase
MTLHLGIDVASREAHRASLTDSTGRFLWRNWKFTSRSEELTELWQMVLEAGDDEPVVVVLEPTRNAWVPVAAWLRAAGAKVELVPAEQSADLRRYYNKHVKNDRLDSELLARLPLLHPEGLTTTQTLGPADSLRRAARRRVSLVTRRTACLQRLDALLELLGPAWFDALGSAAGKTALVVLQRYSDPNVMIRLGRTRLTKLLISSSRGIWREAKADELLAAARESLALWSGGGLDFAELAEDIATEALLVVTTSEQIDVIDERLARLYEAADPEGIVMSTPGLGPVLAPMILGRLGDANRFRDLAAVRSYTGLVPAVEQSGVSDKRQRMTKAGDQVLRYALFLAADQARRVDPTLAARYNRLRAAGKHHNSALCTLGAVLITRIAACWRTGKHYQLRDLDGREITPEEGRKICAQLKPTPIGTGRDKKESRSAPVTGPSTEQPKTRRRRTA